MADYMGKIFHTYSKPDKRLSETVSAEEKCPSFYHNHIPNIHSYAKSETQMVTTPKKNIPKRPRGTPTGATPKQSDKKQNLGSRWSDEEKQFLINYLEVNPPVDTQCISNNYWKECAASMSEELKTSRTSYSCRYYYNRNMKTTQEPSYCSTDPDVMEIDKLYPVSVIQNPKEDSSFQTDISLPPKCMKMDDYNETLIIEDKDTATSALKTRGCRRLTSNDVAKDLLKDKDLKKSLWDLFLLEIEEDARVLTERKLSYLSNTSYEGLAEFEWFGVLKEMLQYQPLLTDVLLAVSTSRKNILSEEHYSSISNELGLIYGILMKRRYKDLSRIQRFIAMSLANEKVHQKVYDRLQAIGVTVSHSTVLKVQQQIGGKFNADLIDAVRSGRRFRIVGDNVNFKVGVSRQRQDKVGHMQHWFGSAAIIQHTNFNNLPIQRPQTPLLQMPPSLFLPSQEDMTIIKKDCIVLVLEIIVEHISAFKCFKPLLQDMKGKLQSPDVFDTTKTNAVIPLPLLCKNEQKYAEVVDVLDSYEQLIEDIYTKAGIQVNDSTKIHIGGDQLTRERFSGAKRLRSTALNSKEKFEHLTPITFEFFHLQMNFLTIMFNLLYNKDSTEAGTLHAEKIKLRRSQVSEDVKNHYDACKELAISVINGHVTAAVLKHFGMDSVGSSLPEAFNEIIFSTITCEQNQTIIERELGEFVEKFILKNAKSLHQVIQPSEPKSYYKVMCLSTEGKPLTLFIPLLSENTTDKNAPDQRDSVYEYAHLLLEMGFAFKCLLMNVNIPNRTRMLPCLKYLMCILKANNNHSKYALEILRLLALQQSLLDEKSAYETFYGLFVNTQGKLDSSFGCDLQMEHIVRLTKEHIKSVHSNKTEKTLIKRTAAFAGMDKIACQFDMTSNCLIRSQRHRIPSAKEDESSIIAGLLRIKPFDYCQGRKMASYPKSVKSSLKNINIDHIKAWIQHHKSNFLYEIGQ